MVVDVGFGRGVEEVFVPIDVGLVRLTALVAVVDGVFPAMLAGLH